jgi:electron transfer flavoprotein beta subunit
MNIAVCVKYVPDATGDRHFEDDRTVDRVGVDGLLSELDEYAVEQALQIKEKAETPDDVLAKAVERGRDGSPYDLVMCGMASTDGSMSVVPAMLAERLGLPQLTLASVVEVQGDQVRIKRDGDTATEVVGGTMPLVLSVTDQSGEARYPSFKGIMAAKKKPLETLSLSDLGVDSGDVGLSVAWSQVEDTTARPPREAGEIVKDEDGTGAKALADFLAAKKFI